MSVRDLVDTYDSENFLKWLEEFPTQVEEAVRLGEQTVPSSEGIDSVYVGGMGGSGIAGDLVAGFLYDSLEVPCRTIRGYQLPASVDGNSLFVGVSYSGGTEETLSMFRAALDRNASCLAVTTGGRLGEIAEQEEVDVVKIPSGQPPRASAPYLFLPPLFYLGQLGLARSPDSESIREATCLLEEMTGQLTPESENNSAVELARKLHDKVNLVYGSFPLTEPLALRLKNQFNENAKMIAVANCLPELNHNEIMGWRQLKQDRSNYQALLLRDSADGERVKKRFEISAEILSEHVGEVHEISGMSGTRLTRFLTLMLYTDYVSFYCALLRGEDPSEIDQITRLKGRL